MLPIKTIKEIDGKLYDFLYFTEGHFVPKYREIPSKKLLKFCDALKSESYFSKLYKNLNQLSTITIFGLALSTPNKNLFMEKVEILFKSALKASKKDFQNTTFYEFCQTNEELLYLIFGKKFEEEFPRWRTNGK